MTTEEVDIYMTEVVSEDLEEELDEVKEDTDKDVVEESSTDMKMELMSQMSSVTLKIQIGPYYQMIQRRGSLRTRYGQSFW